MHTQYRVASMGLTETPVGLRACQGVHEYRHEAAAHQDDLRVAERTAREGLATPSTRVLTEVDPEWFPNGTGLSKGHLVINIPVDPANSYLHLTGRQGSRAAHALTLAAPEERPEEQGCAK